MSFYKNKNMKTINIRRGFTLIELLVVIVIIGILASMAFVGGRAAINSTRRGMINVQIKQVDMALEAYHQKYGEYPPDFSNEADVLKHIRKRWPKFNWFGKPQTLAGFCDLINAATSTRKFLDGRPYPSGYHYNFTDNNTSPTRHFGALAFWLGGVPNAETGMLNGFSADVSNPLGLSSATTAENITQWEEAAMDLTINDNCQIVGGIPVIIGYKLPIAYFKPKGTGKYEDSRLNLLQLQLPATFGEWKDLGTVVPYAKSGTTVADAVWHNPKRFQLIHPGLDGQFGTGTFRAIDASKDTRSPDFTLADEDNEANFGGTTIDTAGN